MTKQRENLEHLWALVLRADEGDVDALAKAEAFIDATPDVLERVVTLQHGMMQEQINRLFPNGKTPGTKLLVQRRFAKMRRELKAGTTGCAAELLADQVALDWLGAQAAQLASLTSIASLEAVNKPSVALIERVVRLDDAVDKAHERFVRSSLALADLQDEG